MAQAGQTHRRKDGTQGRTGSGNGARSRQGSGSRQAASSRQSRNGHQNGAGKTSASATKSGATKSRASATKSRATKSRASATKSRATKSRASATKSRAASTQSRQQRRPHNRQSEQGTPDPRWGLVPLTAAGIGGAAWALLRKRRSAHSSVPGLDLSSALELVDREFGGVTDLAQAAGRGSRRLAKTASRSALPAAKRFLQMGTKEAKAATGSAGGTTKRFLKARAKEIQAAIPDRDSPRPAARLAEHLTSRGQRLASQVPAEPEQAWPLALALLPATAYSAARLTATHRLPIQCSVDVAVPIEVVYDEWMQLECLPEGSHCVTEIERTDDDRLEGRIRSALHSIDWEAEILDERDCESFAWRSTEGSDCAGLITFHRLGERLTRLELQLDVVPVHGREAIGLSLRTADRRAEAQLRRFKARLETMSPDAYEAGQGTEQTDQDEEKED